MRAILCLATVASCLLLVAASPAVADEESAKAALDEAGFRVSGSNVVAKLEGEISSALRSITKQRKELLTATRELAGVQGQVNEHKATIARLTQQHVALSAQLANVPAGNVAAHNKLVGALNAIRGQIELLKGQQPQADEAIATARADWNSSREAYLQQVLDIRQMVDDAMALYENSDDNDPLQEAVAELSKATDEEYQVKPSRGLLSAIRKLESMENDVLSESIPLRRQGNTLYASVVVNGKYDKEMIVDSGASIISLPAAIAKELGVQPTKEDPMIQLVMADGRTIMGQLVTLEEVRVGQFTVENVEAAVLGPDAVNAEPLLGMSFLGNFKFELDAKAATLTMVDVEGANPATEKPSRRRR